MKWLIPILLVAACGGPQVEHALAEPTPIIIDLTTSGYTNFNGWYVDGDSVVFTHWCSYKCIPSKWIITFTGCGPQINPAESVTGGVNRISYAGDQQICYQSANPPFDTVGCISFASCTISGAPWPSSVFRFDSYDDVSKLFTVTNFAGQQVGQVAIQ
jgi:hypothetical protein